MRCKLERHLYIAKNAQDEYEAMRSESRQGISVSAEELNRIDQIVSPLIKQGQSIHMICVNHADEIMLDFHGKSVIENARRKKQLKLTKLVSVVVVMKIFRII